MATQNYGTVPSRNTSVASPPPRPRRRGLLEEGMERTVAPAPVQPRPMPLRPPPVLPVKPVRRKVIP